MADGGTATMQTSNRSYEDAVVAMNSLITPTADLPPRDPTTGALNWNAHFRSFFRFIEVC